jgi:hypothetical protein
VSLEHDFGRPSPFSWRQKYEVIVLAGSDDGKEEYVGRFPFEIDELTPMLEAGRAGAEIRALLLPGPAAMIWYLRRRRRVKQA